MQPTFYKWPKCHRFAATRKGVCESAEFHGVDPEPVEFIHKTKLHGTNAAVQLSPGGLVAQSRNRVLTVDNDNMGFADFITNAGVEFPIRQEGLVLYGEWAGPGIQHGCAVNQAPEKFWAVFAARMPDDTIVSAPYYLSTLVHPHPRVHILPASEPFLVGWDHKESALLVDALNTVVNAVESEDPFMKTAFDVSGIGEGVVCMPTKRMPVGQFARLMFKCKGRAHAGIKAPPAQVDPTAAANEAAFVELVVTPARLEQGVEEALGGVVDVTRTRDFIDWVMGDVLAECGPEIEASGLPSRRIKKAVCGAAGAHLRRLAR